MPVGAIHDNQDNSEEKDCDNVNPRRACFLQVQTPSSYDEYVSRVNKMTRKKQLFKDDNHDK